MRNKTAIILFCDDFRIQDNPALYYACKRYKNIIPLFVYNNNYLGRELGAAAKVFLYKVLESFDSLLKQKYDINLVIHKGDVVDILKNIIPQVDAIYFNTCYTLAQIQTEKQIKNHFHNLDIQTFKANLLFHPWEITPQSGGEFYKVFTPFSRECLKNIHLIEEPLPSPEKLHSSHNIRGVSLGSLELLPKNEGGWYKNLLKHWEFCYEKVEKNFGNFLDNKLALYNDNRNTPSLNGTSGISPYLRFGMLSPRVCFSAATFTAKQLNHQFALELLWREFAYHVMYSHQSIAIQELKPTYKKFKWQEDEGFLTQWQNGETGYDMVDAGMKELYATGVMHNRLRMVTSSFLTKNLLIHWKEGEKWFWNTLVDADPAVNPFSWQWVFGSGFDAAPYFRIFNPLSQEKRFDPKKIYCNKWLQNSKRPPKCVDHSYQRQIALENYKNLLKDS